MTDSSASISDVGLVVHTGKARAVAAADVVRGWAREQKPICNHMHLRRAHLRRPCPLHKEVSR